MHAASPIMQHGVVLISNILRTLRIQPDFARQSPEPKPARPKRLNRVDESPLQAVDVPRVRRLSNQADLIQTARPVAGAVQVALVSLLCSAGLLGLFVLGREQGALLGGGEVGEAPAVAGAEVGELIAQDGLLFERAGAQLLEGRGVGWGGGGGEGRRRRGLVWRWGGQVGVWTARWS